MQGINSIDACFCIYQTATQGINSWSGEINARGGGSNWQIRDSNSCVGDKDVTIGGYDFCVSVINFQDEGINFCGGDFNFLVGDVTFRGGKRNEVNIDIDGVLQMFHSSLLQAIRFCLKDCNLIRSVNNEFLNILNQIINE